MPKTKHHSKKMTNREWIKRKNKRKYWEAKVKKIKQLEAMMNLFSAGEKQELQNVIDNITKKTTI